MGTSTIEHSLVPVDKVFFADEPPHHQPVADLVVLPIPSSRQDENPALVYLASLAPGSRRTMTGALATIAAILVKKTEGEDELIASDSAERVRRIVSLPWGKLRFQHTMAVRAVLAERYSFASANKMLSALRGTLKSAWRLGQMSAEEYQRAADLSRVQGETLPAGRSLAFGEIAALIAVCQADSRPAGVRDAAICSLLYGCGLRRAELASLSVADCDMGGEGNGENAGTLKILGKRNKQRLVPVVGGAAAALAGWLKIRGDAPGALFVPTRRGGKLWIVLGEGGTVVAGMTAQAVYQILIERAKEAGVAAFSPHDFRRTFVGDLLDRGADIATVQKMAGHASVTTTARYDRRGERAKRQAAELLHVPFTR